MFNSNHSFQSFQSRAALLRLTISAACMHFRSCETSRACGELQLRGTQANHIKYSEKHHRQEYNKKREFEAVDLHDPMPEEVVQLSMFY